MTSRYRFTITYGTRQSSFGPKTSESCSWVEKQKTIASWFWAAVADDWLYDFYYMNMTSMSSYYVHLLWLCWLPDIIYQANIIYSNKHSSYTGPSSETRRLPTPRMTAADGPVVVSRWCWRSRRRAHSLTDTSIKKNQVDYLYAFDMMLICGITFAFVFFSAWWRFFLHDEMTTVVLHEQHIR